jgi:hypothetical protein
MGEHRAGNGCEHGCQRGDIERDTEDVGRLACHTGDGSNQRGRERQAKLGAPQPCRRGPVGVSAHFIELDLSIHPLLNVLIWRESGPRYRARPGIGNQHRDEVVTVILDFLTLGVKQGLGVRLIVRRGADSEFVRLAFERLRNRACAHPGRNMFLAEQALREKSRGGEAERARNDEPSAWIGGGGARRWVDRRAQLTRHRRQESTQDREDEHGPARSIDGRFERICGG